MRLGVQTICTHYAEGTNGKDPCSYSEIKSWYTSSWCFSLLRWRSGLKYLGSIFYNQGKITAFPSMDFLWLEKKVAMNHLWPIDGLFMNFLWSIDWIHWEPNPGNRTLNIFNEKFKRWRFKSPDFFRLCPPPPPSLLVQITGTPQKHVPDFNIVVYFVMARAL